MPEVAVKVVQTVGRQVGVVQHVVQTVKVVQVGTPGRQGRAGSGGTGGSSGGTPIEQDFAVNTSGAQSFLLAFLPLSNSLQWLNNGIENRIQDITLTGRTVTIAAGLQIEPGDEVSFKYEY